MAFVLISLLIVFHLIFILHGREKNINKILEVGLEEYAKKEKDGKIGWTNSICSTIMSPSQRYQFLLQRICCEISNKEN
jgi:hypothetical protein